MKLMLKSSFVRPCFLTASFVAASVAYGQTGQQEAPPIDILKIKCEKEVRLPRNFDPSIISATGTFIDPRAAVAPSNAVDATRAATKARNDAAEAETVFPAIPRRLPQFYVYSVKVRNTSARTIQAVAWDYLFLDAIENKARGSHRFFNYQKLAPGKMATLRGSLRSLPVSVLQLAPQNGTSPKLTEKAVIECILYSDGSVWRSLMAPAGVCDLLKDNKARAGH
jgi:hypothetical protein